MSTVNRTLQRLDRILLLVPWLLEHPGVALDEVCERFEVTRDELVADLDVLGYCGLPGYGGGDLVEVSLFGDCVTVRMADFFSRPLRLSVREAVTLLLAGEALAGVHGLPESAPLQRAVGKLRRTLGADPSVTVDLSAPGDELLPQLRAAVADHAVLRLVYRSASRGETTTREVEPVAVVAAQGAWYLQGWCRLAGGRRDFRLDRIAGLERTGAVAEPRGDVEPQPPRYAPAADDITVVVDLAPDAWWVADWVVADAVQQRRGNVRRVTFRTRALDWPARLVLRLGDAVRVVEPPELRAHARALAARAVDRYRHHAGPRHPAGS